MAKQIACGDLVAGCAYTATADTEEDLLKQVVEHAATAHGVQELTPELAAQVKSAIRSR